MLKEAREMREQIIVDSKNDAQEQGQKLPSKLKRLSKVKKMLQWQN